MRIKLNNVFFILFFVTSKWWIRQCLLHKWCCSLQPLSGVRPRVRRQRFRWCCWWTDQWQWSRQSYHQLHRPFWWKHRSHFRWHTWRPWRKGNRRQRHDACFWVAWEWTRRWWNVDWRWGDCGGKICVWNFKWIIILFGDRVILMFVFYCCLAFSQMLFACSLVFNIIFLL